MPRAQPSAPIATAAPRRSRSRKIPTDPVLAGFARYSEQLAATPEPAPVQVVTPSSPVAPPGGRLHLVVLVLVISGALVAARSHLPRLPWPGSSSNPAAQAVRNYAALIDSEIVETLHARLAEKESLGERLTGEEALKIIETARPVIAKHAFSPLAQSLTDLQSIDDPLTKDVVEPSGEFHSATLGPFLDEVSRGLRSIR